MTLFGGTMDSDRWKRVQTLFEAALERDEADRRRFLRAECGDDDDLLAEVVSLIESDASDRAFLDGLAAGAVGEGELPPLEGTRVDQYEIVRLIGSGGMGSVYLAERADGAFDQQVALKLIKRGMDSEEILRRFHTERQILARLRHPNIALLLGGGVTADSLPYFTMEYVEGDSLLDYCAERRSSLSDRLDLFRTVCAAVAYAQRNLIVHRDLKPTNILVTGRGVVKLLDFGIAKVLDPTPGPGRLTITQPGKGAMTPNYASPEQLRGEGITTATDVYSLGVILYELLTGRPPFDWKDETPAEIESAIRTTAPERPSRAVGAPGATVRGANPAKLKRRLAGDLDNICLKALRSEPERRYASAAELLDDLTAYSRGRPVSARRDTFRYRASKFVARNRGPVLGAGVALAVLAGTMWYHTARLAEERDRAKLEAEKATTVSDFLAGLFRVAEPSESRGETVTARELLDRGAARIDEELGDQPAVHATMLDVVSEVYQSLGLYGEAEPRAAKALAIRRELYGSDGPELAQSFDRLGTILRDQGEYDRAERTAREAVAIARRHYEEADPVLAASVGNLAWVLNLEGEFDEAERLYEEALAMREELGEEEEAAFIMNNLALLRNERGEMKRAEPMFREALAIQRRTLGNDHPETATTIFNLSQLLKSMGRFEEAESLAVECLAIDRKLHGERHPDVASSLTNLGNLRQQMGKYEEAKSDFYEALSIKREFFGDEHPEVAAELVAIARLHHDLGEFSTADSLLREALAMRQRLHGDEHPEIVKITNHLGWLLYDLGDYETAAEYHRRAIAMGESLIGPDCWMVAIGRLQLGRALTAMGRVDEARSEVRRAMDWAETKFSEPHPFIASCRSVLATVERRAGNPDEAERLAGRSLDDFREIFGDRHPRIAQLIHLIAGLAEDRGNLREAERLYRDAIERRRRCLPDDHPDLASSLAALGSLLCEDSRGEEGRPLLLEALAIQERKLPPDHPDTRETRAALAHCTGSAD